MNAHWLDKEREYTSLIASSMVQDGEHIGPMGGVRYSGMPWSLLAEHALSISVRWVEKSGLDTWSAQCSYIGQGGHTGLFAFPG